MRRIANISLGVCALLIASCDLQPQRNVDVRNIPYAGREAIFAGNFPELDLTDWLNVDEQPTWERFKGKVVLLDFWGTWCGPCVAKIPKLQPLHEKYADRGLAILAIHSAQRGDACEDFIRRNNFTFPVAIDSGATAKRFGVYGWPTYFLINRQGKVVQGYIHDVPTAEAIEQLLNEPGT